MAFSILLSTVSGSDMLDSLIYITIVLLVLSVITEKATQLTRVYPTQCHILIILGIIGFYALIAYSRLTPPPVSKIDKHFTEIIEGKNSDVKKTEDKPIAEKKVVKKEAQLTSTDAIVLVLINSFFLFAFFITLPKIRDSKNITGLSSKIMLFANVSKNAPVTEGSKVERDVMLLSFTAGFVVSYLFNADLIQLFKDPKQTLGWQDVSPFIGNTLQLNSYFFGFDPIKAIGFLLTGFFLSFGSKFFHDLLDTLLQVKNLRRKLNDKQTYDVDTIAEFDQYLKLTSGEIVQKAIEENLKWLKALPGFISVHPCFDPAKSDGSKIACLNLSGPNDTNVANVLSFTLPAGTRKTLPLLVMPNVKRAKVHYGQVPENKISYWGSLACPIQDSNNVEWLLTCGHVMRNGAYDSSLGQQGAIPGQPVKFLVSSKTPIPGSWEYVYQDNEFDIALIRATAPSVVPTSGFNPSALPISQVGPATQLQFKGAASFGTGYLFASDVEDWVSFANMDVMMKGLLKIRSQAGTGISQSGDSGAMLVDSSNNAVAMIIAANADYTLAIPMEKIMSGWNASIL